MLARFHETAVRGGPIEAACSAGAVSARWRQNLIELQRLSGAIISPASIREMARLASQFLSGRTELLAERIIGPFH